MDLLQVMIALSLVGVCGALAELPTGFSTGGFVVATVIGVIGAFLGMWGANLIGLTPLFAIKIGTITLDLLYTFLGSLVMVVVLEATRALLQRNTHDLSV